MKEIDQDWVMKELTNKQKNKLNKNKWSGTFIVDYIPTKHSDDIMIVREGKLYKRFYGLFRKVKKLN